MNYERYSELVQNVAYYISSAAGWQNLSNYEGDPLNAASDSCLGECKRDLSELEEVCRKLNIASPFRK